MSSQICISFFQQHVYFFFRETAVEYLNCGKVRQSIKKK